MANRTEVNQLVSKLLKAYPQMKFSAEAITGFVDVLSQKLTPFPGGLLPEAADKFIETEIDFPRFNVAAVMHYCWGVRSEKMDALTNKLQSFKDDWYVGVIHPRDEWQKLGGDFDALNATEMAGAVRERMETMTRKIEPVPQDKIAEGQKKIKQALEAK